MINGTNVLRDDNPRWTSIHVTEIAPASNGTRDHEDRAGRRLANIASGAGQPPKIPRKIPRKPVGISHRITPYIREIIRDVGANLHSLSDAEAGWRGWQVTELRGGLSRRYRDPRFDKLTRQTQGGQQA